MWEEGAPPIFCSNVIEMKNYYLKTHYPHRIQVRSFPMGYKFDESSFHKWCHDTFGLPFILFPDENMVSVVRNLDSLWGLWNGIYCFRDIDSMFLIKLTWFDYKESLGLS